MVQGPKTGLEEYVLAPTKEFVIELGDRLKTITPGITFDIRTNGNWSIMRIYRDLRFSKDKSPYNTRIRLIFWVRSGKKMESPGLFIVIDPAGAAVYAGMHEFPKPALTVYRDAVVDNKLGTELETVLDTVKKAGYETGSEHYKRVLRGYDQEHQRAGLLRYNGLWALSPLISPDVIQTPKLIDACFDRCQNMMPLMDWLTKVL
jgi:uncharacterized protein (TIGR02453 family)